MKDVLISQLAYDIHFKKIDTDELRQSPSVNLVDSEGKFVGIMVIPASGEKRIQIQSLCSQMNTALFGED